MFNIACCLVAGLGLGLGLASQVYLVSGCLVVMHTYLYYSRLSVSHCPRCRGARPAIPRFVKYSVGQAPAYSASAGTLRTFAPRGRQCNTGRVAGQSLVGRRYLRSAKKAAAE